MDARSGIGVVGLAMVLGAMVLGLPSPSLHAEPAGGAMVLVQGAQAPLVPPKPVAAAAEKAQDNVPEKVQDKSQDKIVDNSPEAIMKSSLSAEGEGRRSHRPADAGRR